MKCHVPLYGLSVMLVGLICTAAGGQSGGTVAGGQAPEAAAAPATASQPVWTARASQAMGPSQAPDVRVPPAADVRPGRYVGIGSRVVAYPPNWAQVSRRAERYGAMQRMEDEPTRQARERMAMLVPEIGFEAGTTFAEALERIRQGSGLNIVVIWPALESFGITPEQEVSMPTLRNVSWRKVLSLVLGQVDAATGGIARLTWAVDGGVVTVSSLQEQSRHISVRVYDVGDLLVPRQTVPRGTGFMLGIGNTGNTGGTAGGTTAGGAGG